MKFTDTKGRLHSIDIRPSRWPQKALGEGKGKFQSKIGSLLNDIYPGDIICEEFPCVGEGLQLDFFIPRKKVAVEVQGRQHNEFVEFFHGTAEGFKAQKARDSRKEEWCELNGIRLVKIEWGAKTNNIISLVLDE